MEVRKILVGGTPSSGSSAREPIAWDGSLSSLGGKLAVNDGAAGRELHRKPGVVLVVDNCVLVSVKLRFAGDEIAEGVNALAPNEPLLDRLQQLYLPVGGDALPVVDDDRARAREGLLVDLAAHVEYVGVGDGDHHLAGLEPVTVEHRRLRVGGAAHNM